MVSPGIEVLLAQRRDLLRGKRVGFVGNYTVTDSRLRPVIDLLWDSREWRLSVLFGPEHGIKNAAREGQPVSSEIDPHTGLMSYSLYGDLYKPTGAMLRDIDVLVIDLPDIGSRYYTNMSTLAYCLEICGELGLPAVVLDRPNPLGGVRREGNLPEKSYYSFVCMYPVPIRHGLTTGELARLYDSKLERPADLTVVPVEGWEREQMFPATGLPFVPASPNTNSFEMCVLYPGTCLFEGTNLSVGRGTANPFAIIGAPWVNGHQIADVFNALKLPGIVARPVYFTPWYSIHQGELCSGVQLHVVDAEALEPVRAGLALLQIVAQEYQDFAFLPGSDNKLPPIDRLAGTDKLRLAVSQGRALAYLDEARPDVQDFATSIKPFLLY
ncbi:MAG TPA: DUF1343 domain-containing protein [Ktedonobacteraceae bacterium]|nr:DUF1343 domain-containing protein [Ktedonobacteraceae bacterium]